MSLLPRIGLVLLLMAAAWLLIREQRDEQTRRSRELEQQIATLNDRIVNLEGEIATLMKQPRSLSLTQCRNCLRGTGTLGTHQPGTVRTVRTRTHRKRRRSRQNQ